MNYKTATAIATYPLAYSLAECEQALAVISAKIGSATKAAAYLTEAILTEQVA